MVLKLSVSCTLLWTSCDRFVLFLVQSGATPLIIASQNGHTKVVTILLRNSAGVDTARNVSQPLVHVMCLNTNAVDPVIGHLL